MRTSSMAAGAARPMGAFCGAGSGYMFGLPGPRLRDAESGRWVEWWELRL